MSANTVIPGQTADAVLGAVCKANIPMQVINKFNFKRQILATCTWWSGKQVVVWNGVFMGIYGIYAMKV